MKYLVTGAAGFIGGHIARTLAAQGHQVSGIDIRPFASDIPFEGYDCNIENLATLRKYVAGCDGIYHMAAIASVPQSFEDPDGTYATNVLGTRNVFQAALDEGGIPVVYASSAAIYGDNDALPLKETEEPKPMSPYAEHKLANEKEAKEFGAQGLPSFGLRFFNIYGPGQDPSSPYSGVISIFHDKLQNRQPITIYGDGKQTRDFVYVGDTVQGCLHAMRRADKAAPIANICRGDTIEIRELLDLMGEVMHSPPDIAYSEGRSGDIRYSCGAPSRLQELTGFTPQTGMKEGLERLISGRL